MTELIYRELSEQIIGAAMAVHNELRPGLDEKLYENALCIEFAERGLRFEQQQSFPVYYKSHFVGKLVPDLIVEAKIVLDTKVVQAFNDTHIAQMLGYLNITTLRLGLLIDFKHATLQWKRIVR